MGHNTSTISQTAGPKISVDAMSQTHSLNSTYPSGPGTVDNDKIMAAVSSCQTALMSKIDDLQADINHLMYGIDKVKDRTSEEMFGVGQECYTYD